MAIDLIIRNNVELMRGVDRATNVTVSALQVAVTLALALANQKITLDKILAVNETTDKLIGRERGAPAHAGCRDPQDGGGHQPQHRRAEEGVRGHQGGARRHLDASARKRCPRWRRRSSSSTSCPTTRADDREHGERAQDRQLDRNPAGSTAITETQHEATFCSACCSHSPRPRAAGAAQTKFNVAWSHYTGWEPWAYMQQAGILDKWAKKYKHRRSSSRWSTTTSSRSTCTPPASSTRCAMTNMDVLTIPAVGGVDSHGADRRRLLQRQRRHRAQERQDA